MSHPQQDEVSLTNFTKEFERYSWRSLHADIIAGLSVAMLTVPQAMAYALVAGLPISAGLYSAVFSAIIVALFGSSRHLIVGPTNAIAILIQGGIAGVLFTYYRDVVGVEREELALQILTQLMLLVGVIQILAAFLKLGRLTHFVSHTVIIAYVSGVALALVINQMFAFLGMSIPTNVSSLFERTAYMLTHLNAIHWPTAAIGISCFLFMLILKRIDRRMPAGAMMLAIVAVTAFFLTHFYSYFQGEESQLFDLSRFEGYFQNITVVGETKGDGFFPRLDWPYFNTGIMNNLLPVAFAIALLSVMEATSTAKSIAANSGQHLSTNQEIFGLGMGNFVSAFIGAMPVSGSPSRTILNYENGGKHA